MTRPQTTCKLGGHTSKRVYTHFPPRDGSLISVSSASGPNYLISSANSLSRPRHPQTTGTTPLRLSCSTRIDPGVWQQIGLFSLVRGRRLHAHTSSSSSQSDINISRWAGISARQVGKPGAPRQPVNEWPIPPSPRHGLRLRSAILTRCVVGSVLVALHHPPPS